MKTVGGRPCCAFVLLIGGRDGGVDSADQVKRNRNSRSGGGRSSVLLGWGFCLPLARRQKIQG